MSKETRTILAIAWMQGQMRLAELQAAGGASATVLRRSTLTWEPEADQANPSGVLNPLGCSPQTLGEKLQDHLQANGYASRQVAVGLPGTWALARHWNLPPVDDEALAGILRLRLEKEFGSGPTPLEFDFCSAPSTAGQRGVLMVGVRKDRLDAVKDTLVAAGLSPLSIGVTAADVAQHPDARQIVIESSAVTVCGRSGGQLYGFVSAAKPKQSGRWASDVSRLLATLPTLPDIAPGPLHEIVFSEHAEDPDASRNPVLPDAELIQVDPAQAVGQAALQSKGAAVNWLADRLNPPKPKRISPSAMWGIRAAAVLIAIGLTTGFFWVRATSHRDHLQQQLQAIASDADRLSEMHQRTRDAANWFGQRPPVMDCLLELTRTFPTKGRIWVTQFSVDEARQGVVRCKAENKDTMLAYLEAMQGSEALRDIELRDWNESGTENRTVVFEITFVFDDSAPRSAQNHPQEMTVDETMSDDREVAG